MPRSEIQRVSEAVKFRHRWTEGPSQDKVAQVTVITSKSVTAAVTAVAAVLSVFSKGFLLFEMFSQILCILPCINTPCWTLS